MSYFLTCFGDLEIDNCHLLKTNTVPSKIIVSMNIFHSYRTTLVVVNSPFKVYYIWTFVVNVSERCDFFPFKWGRGGLQKTITSFLFLETLNLLNGPLWLLRLPKKLSHLAIIALLHQQRVLNAWMASSAPPKAPLVCSVFTRRSVPIDGLTLVYKMKYTVNLFL